MRWWKSVPGLIVLSLVSLLFFFPFYWLVISSLKSVAGLDLLPPSAYPAEVRTVPIQLPAHPVTVMADGKAWILLIGSVDRLATPPSSQPGGYYLEVSQGKPTQHVAWWANEQVKAGSPLPAGFVIPPVPMLLVDGHEFGQVAKMNRQSDAGFDELLFTVPASQASFGRLQVQKNVSHQEVRVFHADLSNYTKALKGPDATIGGTSSGFLLFMRNSLFISFMAVLGQVLTSSLVAFGFSRLNFKGRDTLFVVLIATLMVPAQVTLIPLFSIYKSLGWIDTFLPLIVPHFTAGAFNVFLIRQFMLGFPKELDESAAIDGASAWRVFRSVIFPNCTPVLIVVGLFTFVGSWQDVLGPLIYLDSPKYRTVSLGLEYFRSPYVDNRPVLLAGAVLAIVPVALLFLVAQRYILSGIATTGLK